MGVPKFDAFFSPILKCLADGAVKSRKDVRAFCAKEMGLSNEDLAEVIPSGQSRFFNRTNWACSYLKTAGLVVSGHNKGEMSITKDGLAALQIDSGVVSLQYIISCPKFIEHEALVKGGKRLNENYREQAVADNDLVPKERIEQALEEINGALADELMEQVLNLKDTAFEKLILVLLKRMGYGDFQTTKISGDEGVDGFAYEDQFRFYSIYTQAKKWEQTRSVSRPEIQKFLGALAGQGATRGIFMTTARFTAQAMEYAAKQLSTQIRLVDGNELMQLMIKYGIGVSDEAKYTVKRIDTDFFTEEL